MTQPRRAGRSLPRMVARYLCAAAGALAVLLVWGIARAPNEERARRPRASIEPRQVHLWLAMSRDAIERGEPDLARANAQRVLDLDPDNVRAKELILSAATVKDSSDWPAEREAFNKRWSKAMKRLAAGCDLTGPGPLNYPDNWGEIAQR